jgi:hypothetical protein
MIWRCGLAGGGNGATIARLPLNPMSRPHSHRYRCAWILPITLTAALSACNPAVSDFDLQSAKSQAQAARSRLAKMEIELKALSAEVKKLTGFSGPDYEARMKEADRLRKEKADIEAIKADVEAKVEQFMTGAKTHRESLAAEKP